MTNQKPKLQVTLLATAFIGICTFYPCISKTQTLQDVIKEACAASHYPGLPPCGQEITLDELNSRLHYKLHIMEAEDEQMKNTMSSWNKTLGMLYLRPTQTVWEANQNMAKALSADFVWSQASRAIDAEGSLFLADTNGDPNKVRKHIIQYLQMTGMDEERIQILQNLKTEKINPILLFHVDRPHQ